MIVIILSTLDRYARENNKLLCGPTENFVKELVGDERYATAHVRLTSNHSPIPADTTHVLLLGELAMQQWMGRSGLNAWRGYVSLQSITGAARPVYTVATYAAIDCVDVKDYEGDDDDEGDEDAGNNKDTAPTARSNYRFWALSDAAKLFTNPSTLRTQNGLLFPTAREFDALLTTQGSTVYFDIETHPETNTLQCFSYAIDDGPVLTVGVYDYRGNLIAPPDILARLAILFTRNTIVIHNAAFDLPFLAVNYRVPFGVNIHDTMVMHHRCYPEAEKSLAHVITLYTNAPYHKGDAGTFHPRNRAQYDQLLTYNARDVDTLRAVYKGILTHAAHDSALLNSINKANNSMYPYLVAGLLGFNLDLQKRRTLIADLTNRIKYYTTILNHLVGEELNPASPKQCGDYFYTELGYKVVKRTKTGQPSVAGDAMYLILLDQPANPVPRVILAMRDAEKQLSQLTFKPIDWVHEV